MGYTDSCFTELHLERIVLCTFSYLKSQPQNSPNMFAWGLKKCTPKGNFVDNLQESQN